jgi:tetratricopeptide (TPR) repeat protein
VLGLTLLAACQQLWDTTDDALQRLNLASQIRTLAELDDTWGDATTEQVACFIQAAVLYRELQFDVLAEPLFTRALTISQRIYGLQHIQLAELQSELAQLYTRLQQFRLAETYAQQVVTTTSAALGINHPQVLAALNALGRIYQLQNKKEEARACFQKTVSLAERLGQGDSPWVTAARAGWRACQDT